MFFHHETPAHGVLAEAVYGQWLQKLPFQLQQRGRITGKNRLHGIEKAFVSGLGRQVAR